MIKTIISVITNKLNKQFNLSIYFALANFITGGLLLACIVYPGIISAQAQRTWYRFSYYKILPGKERELRSMMETVDAKVQQERVNSGAITGWYVYEMLSPTGSSAEYDYVTVTATNSHNSIFETTYTFDSAFKKIFPGKDAKFFADYYSKLSIVCSLAKEEVYAEFAVADSSSQDGFKFKYLIVDFMQPKPEKGGEYYKMETDTFRLIHKERIKLGAISQWAFLGLQWPFDMKTRYSDLAINFYNDMDMIFDSKYTEALKTTFPTVELGNLFKSSSALRDNPKADFMRLVLSALPEKR